MATLKRPIEAGDRILRHFGLSSIADGWFSTDDLSPPLVSSRCFISLPFQRAGHEYKQAFGIVRMANLLLSYRQLISSRLHFSQPKPLQWY